jgi:hypothetical protein
MVTRTPLNFLCTYSTWPVLFLEMTGENFTLLLLFFSLFLSPAHLPHLTSLSVTLFKTEHVKLFLKF